MRGIEQDREQSHFTFITAFIFINHILLWTELSKKWVYGVLKGLSLCILKDCDLDYCIELEATDDHIDTVLYIIYIGMQLVVWITCSWFSYLCSMFEVWW
jgi:hypothetical protein